MQIHNNSNLTFSGIGIVGKIKSEDLPEFNKFISSPLVQANVKLLEEKYNTDVFVLPKVTSVTLKHRKHGYMSKYDMPKFSTSDLMYRMDVVIESFQEAVKKAAKEHEQHMEWLESIISKNKKPA